MHSQIAQLAIITVDVKWRNISCPIQQRYLQLQSSAWTKILLLNTFLITGDSKILKYSGRFTMHHPLDRGM
jgi:hypothetical protein